MGKFSKEELEKSNYWADQIVRKIISEQGLKSEYNIAAGITPSGVVHVGNFREVITNDIVKRALEDFGFKVNFYYSWDDFDRYRKVPKNLPKQEELKSELGKPVCKVFDPFGCHESYSLHFEKTFEEEIKPLNINPIFIYENVEYQNCVYADEIKSALQKENVDKIKVILNKFRKEPLSSDWLPLQVYCKHCFKDDTKILSYDNEYSVNYHCNVCNKDDVVNFKSEGFVKLVWRVDWPMRWFFYDIHFEPGGKDHSTPGGSYDTGKEIVRVVWNKKAPSYLMYDFVIPKGEGGKISSSKGNVITVSDVLKVFTPEILRFIFSGSRPGSEISIPFDENVIKVYEDFDKIERIYYGKEDVEDKEKNNAFRIYEMSVVDNKNIKSDFPFQPKFRELTVLSQIYENDKSLVLKYYESKGFVFDEFDKNRLFERLDRAFFWVNNFAPDNFKFKLNSVDSIDENIVNSFSDKEKELLKLILDNISVSSEELGLLMKDFINNNSLNAKDFFVKVYNLLLNSNRGPKLASFVKMMPEKVKELFNVVLKKG